MVTKRDQGKVRNELPRGMRVLFWVINMFVLLTLMMVLNIHTYVHVSKLIKWYPLISTFYCM